MPTPSSTEAIIAARRRISSWLPAWIEASSARPAGSRSFRANASASAGLERPTTSGGRTLGCGGNTWPR